MFVVTPLSCGQLRQVEGHGLLWCVYIYKHASCRSHDVSLVQDQNHATNLFAVIAAFCTNVHGSFCSALATSFRTSSLSLCRSATSNGMAPALAIVTWVSALLYARSDKVRAAACCVLVLVLCRSATSGGMAPALAIATWVSALLHARLAKAQAAACCVL